MDPWEALVQFWNYLTSLPAPVSAGLLRIAVVLIGIMAIIVMFRKTRTVDVKMFAIPVATWAIADFSQFLYGAFGWEFLLIVYTLAAIVALIMGAVVLTQAVRSPEVH